MNGSTDLSSFNNTWYKPGRSLLVRILWYYTNVCILKSSFPWNGFKIFVLRLFGATIGKGVVIKPHVNIKYPWRLQVGNYVWIGEQAWIDNLADVKIEDHVCISQGAMLLCGNHDYSKSTFDLRVGNITIKSGAWIGAKSVVCPGITVGSHAVLNVSSIATRNLDDYTIYQGNPALEIKKRDLH